MGSCDKVFPSGVWEEIGLGRSDQLTAFFLKLGLRKPTAATSKTICLAYICASHGLAYASILPQQSRLTLSTMFKKQLKSRRCVSSSCSLDLRAARLTRTI